MKQYLKPVITFQSLNMETPATSVCSQMATFAERQCPVDTGWNNETVFTTGVGCTFKDDKIPVCYHVPSAGSNVFES